MRIALVMAGGGGSRLWPVSTPDRPKQFMALRQGQSLLAAAVERAAAVAGLERTFLVTTADLAAAVRAAAPEVAPENVIEEPCPRSTAPCVALAMVHVVARLRALGCSEGQIDETALVVLPSDHHIGDEPRFADLLARACDCAAATGRVIVLGVSPTRPETGYGYIERDVSARAAEGDAHPACGALELHTAVRFVEKPNLARAREFLASGRFLWNAGVCIAPLGRLQAEYGRLTPALWQALAPVAAALREGSPELARARTQVAYAAIEPASVDVAILEQLADLRVAASDVAWTDLGSWAAIREALPRDASGFAVHAENDAAVHVVDGTGGLVWTDGADVAIVGLDGVAVIAAGGRILVCPLERAQEVRAAAEASARHAAASPRGPRRPRE